MIKALENDGCPPTQDFPILEEKERSPLVALGSDLIGSRIYLCDIYMDNSERYASALIVPSDYRLNKQRIAYIYEGVIDSKQIAASNLLRACHKITCHI